MTRSAATKTVISADLFDSKTFGTFFMPEILFDVADAMDLVMEKDPKATFSPSEMRAKLRGFEIETWMVRQLLDWMVRQQYALSAGNGNWTRYYNRLLNR